MRRFSSGRSRPARGRHAMNRAMSSASIRSVFARVPRESAKALIHCPEPHRVAMSREGVPEAVAQPRFLQRKVPSRAAISGRPQPRIRPLQDRIAAGSSRPARYGPRPCQDAETASRQDGRTRPASRVIHPSQEGLSQPSYHALFCCAVP